MNKNRLREELHTFTLRLPGIDQKSLKEYREKNAQKKNIWNGNIYFPTAATGLRNVVIIVCLAFIAVHVFAPETIDQNNIIKEKVTFIPVVIRREIPLNFYSPKSIFN